MTKANQQPYRFECCLQAQRYRRRGTFITLRSTKAKPQVTGSNVVSVAEHVIMSILVLVRNFVPAHDQARSGEWNVANIARNTFDLEDKVVGTVGCGRIGYRVLQRLQPFGCKELLWYDYTDLPEGECLFIQRS
jgi:lactate dehydrogenase-like 2-hydroxyacid dehydrogenase